MLQYCSCKFYDFVSEISQGMVATGLSDEHFSWVFLLMPSKSWLPLAEDDHSKQRILWFNTSNVWTGVSWVVPAKFSEQVLKDSYGTINFAIWFVV